MSRDAFSGGVAGAAQGDEELRMLWRRYKERGDAAARDRLIMTFAPLVKYVAGRMRSALPSHVDEADLISYGLVGLIGAVERFDPGRRVKFETYAVTRIKGAIIDELRSLDWVPRSVRARARADREEVRRAREQAAPRPDRRGAGRGAGDEAGRVPGRPHPDLQRLDRRPRRDVERLAGRRAGLPDGHPGRLAQPPTRPTSWTSATCATPWPTPSRGCPSGSGSWWRSTTTTTSA